MKQYIKYFLIFALINFGGLYIGSIFTTPGVSSDWYNNLNQAPWTPPGWVFGFAWTLIGITYSMWGAWIYKNYNRGDYQTPLYFVGSWFLNVIWNYIFFKLHLTLLAGVVIADLLLILLLISKSTREFYGNKPVGFLVPYIVWLCIATSLNWYIVVMN